MDQADPELVKRLSAAISSHDFLHRVVRAIEHSQMVVFHGSPRADWKKARGSAEHILITEIITRYQADIDGVYLALRKMEQNGLSWPDAIREFAARVQSYYTTPLGIVMRANLLGDDAVFLSPEALEWVGGEVLP